MGDYQEKRREMAFRVLEEGWLQRRETRLDSETGERIWAEPLECSACYGDANELIWVGNVGLCSDCALFVKEAKHFRHSGMLLRLPDPRETDDDTPRQLSDPATSHEALQVYRRDDFTCRYCGETGGDLTVDHIDPEGGNEMGNYATACRSCNSKKGRRTPEEADMELTAVD